MYILNAVLSLCNTDDALSTFAFCTCERALTLVRSYKQCNLPVFCCHRLQVCRCGYRTLHALFHPKQPEKEGKIYSVKHCFVTSFAAWEFDYYCVGIGNNFMKSNLPGVPGCSVHKLYWVDTCLSCSRSTVSRCTTGRRPLQGWGLCPTRPTGSVQ